MRSKFKWIFTLLVAFTMQFSFAQQKTVTGMVSDDLGPVAGANVVNQSTKAGTVTDFDGNYSVSAKKGDVLVVSFAGSTQSVTVGDQSSYNVTLKVVEIAETVVTAFGIVRETKKLAYATEKVAAKELMTAAPINAVTALAGKVSGLNIITKNNGVNPYTSIILSGYKGLTGDKSSLIVIDGVIVEASVLTSLSPDLIKEIQVIRGEQATALYGSQGRNGVIIITTKKAFTELSQVKTRTDFNETAFFYPNLKTDSGGKISFSFTTPESLTKW